MATQRGSRPRPEKTFGPFPGGIGIAVWLNEVDGDEGPRKVRSITLDPRRYRDPESGEWRDAGSYRPGDLPVLAYAIRLAIDYVFTAPIGGQDDAGETPF